MMICPPGRNTRYISLSAVPLHLVVERVEDVERGDEVELAGRERQSGRGCACDLALSAAARVGETAPGDVDAAGAAVAAEHRQVVAGAAAAVEDAADRVAPAVARSSSGRDETAEAAEPEVITLGARRGFEQSVHECVCARRKSSVRARRTVSDILPRGETTVMIPSVRTAAHGGDRLRARGRRVRQEAAAERHRMPPPPPPAETANDDRRRRHRRRRRRRPRHSADKPLTEDEIFAKATPDDLAKSGCSKPVYFAYDSIVADTKQARGMLQKNVEF